MITTITLASMAWSYSTLQPEWIEPVEGLRVDPGAHLVEFDAEACLAPDPEGKLVDYLELFVCSWDSREHESLLATDIKPSDVHAALLLAGARPGSPATFERDGNDLTRTPPQGSTIEVSFHWRENDQAKAAKPWEWVRHVETEEPLKPAAFVFAGSAQSHDGYAADQEGTLISLVVFDVQRGDRRAVGVETIAWADPISHEQEIDDAVWVANADRYPPEGTPVFVRLRVVQDEPED